MDILPEWVTEAKLRCEKMGVLGNSITEGEGNTAGFIGEIATHVYLSGSTLESTLDYDVIYRGHLIDVKTKRTTRPFINGSFDASIAHHNPRQKCHLYAFTRVNEEAEKVWLAGWMGKLDYFDLAEYHRKGDIIGTNNFTVKSNCYNLPYALLHPMGELLSVPQFRSNCV